MPGESKDIEIEGISDRPQLAEEVFICQAIIGKSSGKDRIMKFKIRCEFIEPLISFSTQDICFRCERVCFRIKKKLKLDHALRVCTRIVQILNI